MPRWEAETAKPETYPGLKPTFWTTQADRASWSPGSRSAPCSSINLWIVVLPVTVDINRSPTSLGAFDALNSTFSGRGTEGVAAGERESVRGPYEAECLFALVVAKTKRLGWCTYSGWSNVIFHWSWFVETDYVISLFLIPLWLSWNLI